MLHINMENVSKERTEKQYVRQLPKEFAYHGHIDRHQYYCVKLDEVYLKTVFLKIKWDIS